jgi:hypothetical protein
VGALGHYLEREGVPTAQISLIREQTAAIRPPRALWVPFMLGRPFGAPGDAGFQRRVLLALLSLFERPSGPLLEDYPEDAPAEQAVAGGFACPVSFAGLAQGGGLTGALRDEVRQLASWYELARRRRGRSTVGVFGDSVDSAVAHLTSFLDGPPVQPPAGMNAGTAVKRACDDIRAYYFEAAAAQPGNLSSSAIEHWFWRDTAAARVLFAVRDFCVASDDPSLKPLGKLGLIPRAVMERLQP